MHSNYTSKKNIQILIAALKAYNIRKVIASPGTTNVMFVASIQNDPWFQIFSAIDERSAAYMACGMAYESGEPVVLTCTGATASRNYMSGLTEAYYRNLPIIAITSMMGDELPNNNAPQIIDRSVVPKDVVKLSVTINDIYSNEDLVNTRLLINKAFLALTRDGGGPVHINLLSKFSYDFSVRDLPEFKKIEKYHYDDEVPNINEGNRVAIFVGVHKKWDNDLTELVEAFCREYNAFVITDHTSGYKGMYSIKSAIMASQEQVKYDSYIIDILIDLGEISGDYYNLSCKEVWRVSPDGEVKDRFHKLSKVFEMSEMSFFKKYVSNDRNRCTLSNYHLFKSKIDELRNNIPELPFSNIWISQQLSASLPKNSQIHFGILNSLRSWNFFDIDNSISSICNVGGFGIDGCLSSAVGASLIDSKKICFCILGDLSFFYDMNSIGNRHIKNNLRILLINNGKGTEFKHYSHPGSMFGSDSDSFIAGGGHFGNKSSSLVSDYATNLGFKYISANSKDEFLKKKDYFISSKLTDSPIVFEVFTESDDESQALQVIRNIEKGPYLKKVIKSALGINNITKVKSILKG